MKIVRRVLRVLLVIVVIMAVFVGPYFQTVYQDEPFYQEMIKRLDETSFSTQIGDSSFQVGWATATITPNFPVKLVGYQPRGPHTNVHDSLATQVMLIGNGQQEVAIVMVDLLLFPPLVRQALAQKLPTIGWDINQLYLSASHTHTGFGGWDNSAIGGLLMGGYEAKTIRLISDQIIKAIQAAEKNKQIAELAYAEIPTSGLMENRLDRASATDSLIRAVVVKQESGNQGVLLTYAAHATNINKAIHQLSGDYPRAWVRQLEQDSTIDFAMYCAGMVGSHRTKWMPIKDFEKVGYLADTLSQVTLSGLARAVPIGESTEMGITHLPIPLPDTEMRLTQYLKVYDWAFDAFMGELEAEITVLRLGNILFLGMPCDFSAEIYLDDQLDLAVKEKGLRPIITSFNGFYVGYITADEHQEAKSKEEVRVMSWLGNGKGAYFSEILRKIIAKQE